MRCYRKIKILPRAAALVLSAVLLAGCSPKAPEKETEVVETAASSSEEGNGMEASQPGEPSGLGAEQENTQISAEKADLMLPIAEGLIRSYEEQGLTYDDQDSAYIWWTLYHVAEISNSDHSQEEIVAEEGRLKEYLTAAFSELTELPAIPDELSDLVTYDSANHAYVFRHQTESAGESKISKAEAVFGSLYEFTVHFSYPDGSTSDYTLDAVDYPGSEAPYPFAFISMQPTEYPCTDNC